MSVHYKFKSALEYDTVTFDGLHISVRDLKKSILHQKRIGKNTDFDLQITNAQTKEVYTDDSVLIPKNTSLIVARIPLTAQQKKAWDRAESNQQLSGLTKTVVDAGLDNQDPGAHRLAKAVDLSSLDASEEDKIQAMMTQSTQDYNPSNYMKIRGANQMGDVPSNYTCYRCHQPGHWIKNCPLAATQEPIEIKKSTGIPRSFMVPVEGPSVPGAMMTPTGQFAVPAIDHQAYKEGKKERPPFQHEPEPVVVKPEIPEDLLCTVCKDLLTDAVMIPCCGNSFCDECIRTVLLESEEHECPDCKEKEVSPDTLIPNRFLRTAVNNFKNETGYHKNNLRHPPRSRPPPHQTVVPAAVSTTIAPPGAEGGELVSEPEVKGSALKVLTSGTTTHSQTPASSTIPVLGSTKPKSTEGVPRARSKEDVTHEGSSAVTPASAPAQTPLVPPGQEHPTYPPGARRSVEDRPGTPTIDEHNLDGPPAPALPDTSVPPPNFSGSEPAAPSYHIESLGGRSSTRTFRGDTSYSHHHRYTDRNFGPRGQFDHIQPSYHHDHGGPRPHYPEVDRDGHSMRGGGFRGYHRGRGRPMHGGYRGHAHAHHQPPPPGLTRSSLHNGSQGGTIDDPLEAFERMLREKDERDHKLRRQRRSRSFSRSRSRSTHSRTYSRSRSRSRTPRSRTPRSRTPRSRTPRKRSRTRTRSRSRTRSFTISRSRSRSFSRSPTPRAPIVRDREFSPRRRGGSRYRTPTRSPPAPLPPPPQPRYQRSYKESRSEYDAGSYYEPEFQQYGGGRGHGGRFGQRKDYNKDYYDQNYSSSRYGGDRYPVAPATSDRFTGPSTGRDVHHRPEPLLPHPPAASSRFETQPSFRRYESFEVTPPGTGPDIPVLGTYEKGRYDRSYDRPSTYDARATPEEYLTPPGIDHRRADSLGYGGRDRESNRDRDVGLGGSRDREVTARDREVRDIGSITTRDRDVWDSRDRGSRDRELAASSRDRDRDKDRDLDREKDRDRDRGREYYDRSYEKSYNYASPDIRKRRQSTTPPPRQTGSRERYSGTEHHRHSHGDSRRRALRDVGKENRHTLQQPVEALDVNRDREVEKEPQNRERVLVEVRKEPSVDKDKVKKEKDDKGKKDEEEKGKDKKSKDKKKKKKEKEVDADKAKKKKRKEKKDAKKEGQESQNKSVDKKEKAREETEEKESKEEEKSKEAVKPSASEKVVENKGPTSTAGEKPKSLPLRAMDIPVVKKTPDALYGGIDDARIDTSVVENYGKVEDEKEKINVKDSMNKNEDEVKVKEVLTTEEVDIKREKSLDADAPSNVSEPAKTNVMLAPLPELSKWELDEDMPVSDDRISDGKDGGEDGASSDKSGKVVTSEVLKRAENAIFQKAINAIRPIEPVKRPTSGERKVYSGSEKEKRPAGDVNVTESSDASKKGSDKETREARKTANSIQITIPAAGHVERSVEISAPDSTLTSTKGKSKLDRTKFSSSSSVVVQRGESSSGISPQRVSAKDRLGAKLDGELERKRDEVKDVDREERSRKGQQYKPRSESQDRTSKYSAKKGLKSAVERKSSIARSRSRSPYHRKGASDRKDIRYGDGLEGRRFVSDSGTERRYIDQGSDRKLLEALSRKYSEHESRRREGRHDIERERKVEKRSISQERRKVVDSKERRIVSPERRADRRFDGRDERDRSPEGGRSKHKLKKKAKAESKARRKSTSDKESKRSRKKDKKHKKEKGKKHKEKDEKEIEIPADKDENKSKPKVDTSGIKDTKLDVKSEGDEIKEKTTEGKGDTSSEKVQDKPKKGSRRNPRLASDRKKSTLDEASFEPDYDASSSLDSDADETVLEVEKKADAQDKKMEVIGDKIDEKVSSSKKRERSASTEISTVAEKKRLKADKDFEKNAESEVKRGAKGSNGKGGKKRPKSSSSEGDSSEEESSEEETSSGSSSSSDDSSEDSSVQRRRKKKSSRRHRRKRSKKSRRAETSSDSDSDSDSDDGSSSESEGDRKRSRSSKKHRHHRSKSSKKKKKSKHR